MYGLSTLMGTRCSTASIFAIGIRDSANMITATGSMVAALATRQDEDFKIPLYMPYTP